MGRRSTAPASTSHLATTVRRLRDLQINIQDGAIVFHFASTSDLNDWRASDRSFSVDYTGITLPLLGW